MSKRTCSIENCDRPHEARGWCNTHYGRWKKWGDVRADLPIRPYRPGAICAVVDCDQPHFSAGLCSGCYGRNRWLRNREEMIAQKRQHYAANRERLVAEARLWRANNKERVRATNKRYRQANPEKRSESYRKWRLANLDKKAENQRRREARRAAVPTIRFTTEQLAQRMAYWGDRCWMCGGPNESVDHVIPLTRGGPHCLSNLRPACLSCNASKGDSDWRQTIAV